MAVIDSQSVKTTESGGPCGYDASKKIKGRKRHIAVDAQGNPIVMMVHPADVQDRDGALEVVIQLLATAPTISKLYADMVAMRGRNFERRSGNRVCQTSSRLWNSRRHGVVPPVSRGADLCLDGPMPSLVEG